LCKIVFTFYGALSVFSVAGVAVMQLYGYLRLMGGLHIAFCCILYVSVFQPSCYSGTLHKRDDHSRNLMHRTNGDLGVKLLKLTIKQQAKACLI